MTGNVRRHLGATRVQLQTAAHGSEAGRPRLQSGVARVPRQTKVIACAAAAAASVLLAIRPARGTTYVWTAGDTGNWNATGDWTPTPGASGPTGAGTIAEYPSSAASGSVGVTTITSSGITVGQMEDLAEHGDGWAIAAGSPITMDNTGGSNNLFGDSNAAISSSLSGMMTVQTNIIMANTSLDIGIVGNDPSTQTMTVGTLGSTTITNGDASGSLNLNLEQNELQATYNVVVDSAIGGSGSAIALSNASTGSGTGGVTVAGAVGGASGTGAPVSILNSATGANGITISGALNATVTSITQNSSASSMTLSGTNTNYDGPTYLSAGTLKLGTATALGGNGTTSGTGGTLTIAAGTMLDASATTTISTVNAETWNGNFTFGGSNTLNMGTGAVSLGASVQLSNAGANTLTVGGSVSGSGNLTLVTSAAGGLTFTGGLTGTDNLVLNANSTGNITFSTAAANNAGTITSSGTSTGTAAIGGLGDAVTAIIENSSSSPLTLSGTNAQFTGSAVVSAGTLKMESTSALGFANTVAVGTGGTFDINASNETIAGLNNISGAGGTATNSGASATLTLGGSGNYSFGGVITATTLANLSLTMNGAGTQTLTGSSTYQGATTVNSGTLKLDFSASGAAPSNIISSSSPLTLGGGTLQIVGATTAGTSQAFASTALNAGQSTVSAAPVSGSNLPTVALAAITPSAGAVAQFQGPATINGSGNVNPTGTITTTTAGSGSLGALGAFAPSNSGTAAWGGAYATVGLYDWASTDTTTGGAGTSPYTIIGGSQVTGFYQTTGVNTSGNYDASSGGSNTISSNTPGAQTIRFNNSGALSVSDGTSIWEDLQGVLVTPNIGANNVSIGGSGTIEAARETTAQSDYTVIWQNNTSGYLNISTTLAAGREATNAGSNYDGLVQAGAGTVVYSGSNTYELSTYLDGGYSVITADSGFGNPADGGNTENGQTTTVYLQGGTVVGNANFTLDNSGSNKRPIMLQGPGGGLAATAGNTLTVDGAISGTGLLTIGFGTLPGSGASTANTTAVLGNGTVSLTGTANTYSGVTTISNSSTLNLSASSTNNIPSSRAISIGAGSTLNVDGLTSSQIALASGQALGGTGTVSGGVVVSSGSTISAGTKASLGTGATNATGTLTTGSETWNAGAAYAWKATTLGTASAAKGSGGSGTTGTPSSWDDVAMSALSLSSLGGSNPSFTIQVSDTSTLAPTGYGTYSWIIAQSTAGVTAPSGYNIFVNGSTANSNLLAAPSGGGTAAFALDTSGLSLSGGGATTSASAFTLELVSNGASGDNLVLDYNAAPESGTAMLVLAGALPMLTGRRRRKSRPDSGFPALSAEGAGGSDAR